MAMQIQNSVQILKFNNFLWVCWFLGKNLSNFVPLIWKLHNPYCHNLQSYKTTQLKPRNSILRRTVCWKAGVCEIFSTTHNALQIWRLNYPPGKNHEIWPGQCRSPMFWYVHTGRNCFNLFQISFSANTTDTDPGVSGVSKDQKNWEESETTHCQVDHPPIIE